MKDPLVLFFFSFVFSTLLLHHHHQGVLCQNRSINSTFGFALLAPPRNRSINSKPYVEGFEEGFQVEGVEGRFPPPPPNNQPKKRRNEFHGSFPPMEQTFKPVNVSFLNLTTIPSMACLPSYPNAGITRIIHYLATRKPLPLYACDLYRHSTKTKPQCHFYKTHYPAFGKLVWCPPQSQFLCALIRPFEAVSLSRKHYMNKKNRAQLPFYEVVMSFIRFVQFYNQRDGLCAVDPDYDWTFTNKLLEVYDKYVWLVDQNITAEKELAVKEARVFEDFRREGPKVPRRWREGGGRGERGEGYWKEEEKGGGEGYWKEEEKGGDDEREYGYGW